MSRRSTAPVLAIAVLLALLFCLVLWRPPSRSFAPPPPAPPAPALVEFVLPLEGTLFPPDLAPPAFRWREPQAAVRNWDVRLCSAADAATWFMDLTNRAEWAPSGEQWRSLARQASETDLELRVEGFADGPPHGRFSGRVSFRISKDPVVAPLFYREVILPFSEAVKDPSRIRWRFGSVASPGPPPVVLQDLPVCGNCHSFSKAGALLGMDVDYANDKGSYVLAPVSRSIALSRDRLITWSDFRREDGQLTFGLLSQLSPDGRWVLSTVKDRSIFMVKPDLAFSQLFFPIKGILGVYDRRTKSFSSLPGADSPEYVQSNPCWSPDGKEVVFARRRAEDLRQLKHPESALVTEEEAAEFFARNENFRYDLFRLPFNEGRGGKAVPLEGAGGDGYSNFFPRYSPDGRWIVFCKARSYMLLQSDSALYVLPAAGGKARRMKCNTSRMNSWHSFSPNGRWLVFSSKAWGPYTRLCLTHFDENGNDTPPVLLADLTFPDRAANIPEFVNIAPEAIAELREQFMDDTSFVRAGTDLFNGREYERAEAAFRKALRLNAANDIARFCLGNTLAVGGRYAEAESEFARAAALVPTRAEYHASLGKARRELKRLPEARTALETALRLDPRHLEARAELGRTLFDAGRPAEAAAELAEAAKASPRDAALRYSLAVALFHAGRKEEARKEAWRAREAAKAANQSAHLEQIERFLAAMENEAP